MGFQEPEHSRCRREGGSGQPRGLVRSSQDLEGPADLDLRARAGALCGGAVPAQSDLSAVKSPLHARQQPPRQGGNQVFGPGWCLGGFCAWPEGQFLRAVAADLPSRVGRLSCMASSWAGGRAWDPSPQAHAPSFSEPLGPMSPCLPLTLGSPELSPKGRRPAALAPGMRGPGEEEVRTSWFP